jgi:hypothetical protein
MILQPSWLGSALAPAKSKSLGWNSVPAGLRSGILRFSIHDLQSPDGFARPESLTPQCHLVLKRVI